MDATAYVAVSPVLIVFDAVKSAPYKTEPPDDASTMYAERIVPHEAVAVGNVKTAPFDFVAGFELVAAGKLVVFATTATRAYAVPDDVTSDIDDPVDDVENDDVDSARYMVDGGVYETPLSRKSSTAFSRKADLLPATGLTFFTQSVSGGQQTAGYLHDSTAVWFVTVELAR